MTRIQAVAVGVALSLLVVYAPRTAECASWELGVNNTLALDPSSSDITNYGQGIGVALVEDLRPTQQLVLSAGYGRYTYEASGGICPASRCAADRGRHRTNAFDFGIALRGIQSRDGATFREFMSLGFSTRILHLGEGYGTDGHAMLSLGLGEAVRVGLQKTLIVQGGVAFGGDNVIWIPISLGIQFSSQ